MKAELQFGQSTMHLDDVCSVADRALISFVF